MKVLVAADSFKGSLSSIEVGLAAKKGIMEAYAGAEVDIAAIADGGEGTVEALLHATDGKTVSIQVRTPLMEQTEARYLTFEKHGEKTAFIESAQSTGLHLVSEKMRNPMISNSYGLGEQIKHAMEHGFRDIFIALGGSATNDAGVGMLQALGWKFYGENGDLLEAGGNPLLVIHALDDSEVMPELKNCRFTAVTDVMNPFHGPNGAARIFARQKGANNEQIDLLDQAMERFSNVIEKQYKINVQAVAGTGAAGGLGGALVGFLGAKVVPGIEVIMDLIGLEGKIKHADLVITGEGSLDRQSVMGKVPVGVAKLAKKYNKPVIGIAGRIDTELKELNEHIDSLFSIQTQCRTLEEAMRSDIASKQIEVTAGQIIRLLTINKAITPSDRDGARGRLG